MLKLPITHSRRAHVAGIATLLLAASACRGKHSPTAVKNEEQQEGGPRIASALKMGDASTAAQLLRGFYGLEGNAWRWTAGTFTVLLRPPLIAAQHGATLNLSCSVPDVVIQKLKTTTLTATIGKTKLGSETYTKPGACKFSASVPPELLTSESVTIDFTLDKTLPPTADDKRELGLIAVEVSLESK